MPPILHSAMGSWEPCAAFRRHSTSPSSAAGKPPSAQPYSGCLRISLFLRFLPMRFAFIGCHLIRPFAAMDGYYGLC